ncbi:hypothetical protein E3A20_13060 [Planctomyces bekefii]|uniref:Uncharacterized protein n=1 Tax=Planctomyces bekefii TaxID=1653850 RepID=A0A5C6M621_9PLAN|nr:hypothetical protein E3A20_13060 [Planctomyces bekefii]
MGTTHSRGSSPEWELYPARTSLTTASSAEIKQILIDKVNFQGKFQQRFDSRQEKVSK